MNKHTASKKKTATTAKHTKTAKATTTTTAAPSAPSKPTPTLDWRDIERVVLGAPNAHYRIGEAHSLGDMVRTAMGPDMNGEGTLIEGLDTAADDIHVFVSWMTDADGALADDVIIRRTGAGIEGRIRILAELARRMCSAVDVDAAKAAT